jgi:murein L,D-transpeptidase YafK
MMSTRHKVSLSVVAVSLLLGARSGWAKPDDSKKAWHSDMIVLTVDKSTLKAELKTWPEDPAKSANLRSFRIAVGKAEGDKEHEGDNRTPEGIYFAQSHIDGDTLPEKYGSLAIPIDFPNPIDQVLGKTGHGIWLHGVDREQRVEEAKVTEGCVAFYNSDIAQLSNWLKSYQGLVVIAKDLAQVNRPQDLTDVKKATLDWIGAWAGRQVESYLAFYAPDFRFESHSLKSYADYKRRVFSSYRHMAVNYDGLRVVSHPKYAVSFFNQDFRGDQRFVSVGRKILYWERGGQDGKWRIKREVFQNRRFEQVSFTDAEMASISSASVNNSVTSEKENKGSSNL